MDEPSANGGRKQSEKGQMDFAVIRGQCEVPTDENSTLQVVIDDLSPNSNSGMDVNPELLSFWKI